MPYFKPVLHCTTCIFSDESHCSYILRQVLCNKLLINKLLINKLLIINILKTSEGVVCSCNTMEKKSL